jgi:hypothetical protein
MNKNNDSKRKRKNPKKKGPDKKKKEKKRVPMLINGRRVIDGPTGEDMRITSNQTMLVSPPNQVSVISVQKSYNSLSFMYFALGYMTRALQRGFLPAADDPNDPPFAMAQIVQTLINAATASVPVVQNVPLWLGALINAVGPKQASFHQGKVAYKLLAANSQALPGMQAIPIGSGLYGFTWLSIGPDATPPINGFPASTPITLVPTAQQAAAAYTSLTTYMADQKDPIVSRLNALSPTQTDHPLKGDVSSFAVYSLQIEGTGGSGSGGGIYGVAWNEVPLFRPLLSLVTCALDSTTVAPNSLDRTPVWQNALAGDPVLVGSLLTNTLPLSDWKNKRPIHIKPVDFLEFVDVMALAIQFAIQTFINTNAPAVIDSSILCPLTLQELQILLRNEILWCWDYSQSATQGILPFKPEVNGNQWSPFIVGSNTVPLQTCSMLLPLPFVENIQALGPVKKQYPNGGFELYMPSLGKFYSDVIPWNTYFVTYQGINYPIFQNPTTVYQKKGEKGVPMYVPEIPISMFDGNVGNAFAYINDPQQLTSLVQSWNNWMSGPVGSCFCKVGSVSPHNGIMALLSTPLTRFWFDAVSYEKSSKSFTRRTKERSIDPVVDSRKKKREPAPIYQDREAVSISSNGPFFGSALSVVQQFWVLPSIEIEYDNENGDSTLISRWQFMMEEPFTVPLSVANNGLTLADVHANFASKLIRQGLTPETELVAFLGQQSAQGRGGILSSIAAAVVGAIDPGLASTANSIAAALPF